MISSNLDFSIRVVDHKIPERKEEREQPPGFSYEESFFHNGGYETNKVIQFFLKRNKWIY